MVKTIEIDLCDLEELKKENRNLKEVNKKLGEWVDKLTKDTFGVAEENRKLKKECEENDYLVEDNARWMKKCEEKTTEIKTLNEKVRFLEECLDRKEKLNEKYRKELKNYVYDAKQVRDIC